MGKKTLKFGSALFSLIIVIVLISNVLTVNATTATEVLDLSDTTLLNIVGNNAVTEEIDSDGNSYYVFSGGGTDTYNKITTKKVYSGYLSLTFDVQFESNASDEMFFLRYVETIQAITASIL